MDPVIRESIKPKSLGPRFPSGIPAGMRGAMRSAMRGGDNNSNVIPA